MLAIHHWGSGGCFHFPLSLAADTFLRQSLGNSQTPVSHIDPYFKGPDEDLGKGGSKEGKEYVRQGQGEKFYTEEEQDKAMRTKTWGKDPPLKDRI